MSNTMQIVKYYTKESTDPELSMVWKLILLSDGSNTKNLETVTQQEIQTDLIEEEDIMNEQKTLQSENLLYDLIFNRTFKENMLLKRTVIMRAKDTPLVYARSYWPKDKYEKIMNDKNSGIGQNLANEKIECYREIKSVNLVNWVEKLQTLNGQKTITEENFARGCLIYQHGEPLTYVEEFFTQEMIQFLS